MAISKLHMPELDEPASVSWPRWPLPPLLCQLPLLLHMQRHSDNVLALVQYLEQHLGLTLASR